MTPCDFIVAGVTTKLLSAIGGFLGGVSLLVYMRPSSARDAVVRVGVSIASAVMLSPILTAKLFDAAADNDSQIVMGSSFFIGFCAWNILGAVAKFFEAKQDQNIVQIIKSVNESKTEGQ